MVSPVWLQVTPKKNNEFTMTGGHDIDSGWAKEVVRGGGNSLSKFEQLPKSNVRQLIHVLAGRTTARDASLCMNTNDHGLRNKILRARNKVAHVELLRGLCRDMQ